MLCECHSVTTVVVIFRISGIVAKDEEFLKKKKWVSLC